MDFFERQDAARRKTTLLVVYFVLAVVLMIAVVYAVIVFAFGYASPAEAGGSPELRQWWHPDILVAVAAFMLLLISGGSLYKIAQLRQGGQAVAEMLGGRRIHPSTTDVNERRLLNVVEEMALASGIAVPPVYLLDNEPGINAFAAGYTPDDAVIGINRGTLEYLTRDELQGVIAHEFSHILNGDMRLNLRLMGLLHGILLIAIVGYYTIRVMGSSSRSSSSRDDDKKGGGGGAIIIIGVALMAVGYIGLFFGRLIKAAVSRQREYLADAAAVQFTRNPGGIGGALKKIGGLAAGSTMVTPEAETASHMFFGSAFQTSLVNLFATHPPLADRIRHVEPTFDGNFPKVEPLSGRRIADEVRKAASPQQPRFGFGLGKAAGAVAATQRIPIDPILVLGSVGAPQQAGVSYSRELLASIPEQLDQAVRDPFGARAVVFAMLLDDEAEIAQQQLELLARQDGDATADETSRIAPVVQQIDKSLRLPLIELVQATLTELSPEQYAQFRRSVEELVKADRKISYFEFVLQRILIGNLDRHFQLRRPPAVRYTALGPVLNEVGCLLSSLAHAGQQEPQAAERAYAQAVARLGVDRATMPLAPREQCSLSAIGAALDKLAEATPGIKKRVLTAAVTAAAADGSVTPVEVELLRTIADSLDCPLPPITAIAQTAENTAA
jgi:Zn-dependent protease with chaperone function